MNPTEAYYKTKRTLLLFVGGLLLAIFAGFKIVNGEQKTTILPFQLERPELLATILLVVVLFYLFQLSLQWAAQQAEVQVNKFHRIDFISTAAIGGVSILCYVGSIILPDARNLHVPAISGDFFRLGTLTVVAIIGIAISIFSSQALEWIATWLGKLVKREVASKEDVLLTSLLSGIWFLNFNPKSQNGKKRISFRDDGSIGEGQNKNEATWRIRNGLLEILDSDGRVYSRFFYDPERRIFTHTNDLDTLSIKFQEIARHFEPTNS